MRVCGVVKRSTCTLAALRATNPHRKSLPVFPSFRTATSASGALRTSHAEQVVSPNMSEFQAYSNPDLSGASFTCDLKDGASENGVAYAPPRSIVRIPRRVVLSPNDLVEDTGVFLSATEVGGNRMHHFTSVESQRSILREGVLRATNTSSPYDAVVHKNGTDAADRSPGNGTAADRLAGNGTDAADRLAVPRSLYFRLNSAAEHIHFPFSWYPRAAEPGGEIACLSVDLDVLRSQEYRMFYGSSTPTQFGQDFVIRVHSHVVFAREPEHIDYCVEHFSEIDKTDNRLFCFSDDGAVKISTEIANRVITRAQQEKSKRPHVVAAVVLGDLPLSDDTSSWSKAWRLKSVPTAKVGRFTRVECPICHQAQTSVAQLKVHYRSKHHAFELECDFEDCSYRTNYEYSMLRHKRAAHEGTRDSFTCADTSCEFTTHDRGHLRRHIQAQHEDVVLECDECDFRSRHRASLWRHKRQKHSPPTAATAAPNTSISAPVSHAQCRFCDEKFESPGSLMRHLSLCKVKTEQGH